MGKKTTNKKIPIIDLHGYRESEIYDVIDKFLLKHQNKNTVHIMTGKGKGIVKKTAVTYLKQAGYHFKDLCMSNGKVNSGILEVFMD